MKFACAVLCILALLFLNGTPGHAQQPGQQQRESHKYRAIGTVAGAGGAFVLGVFAGMAMFDDAKNSDRKVWTTALGAAAGGAVGGYFIGRALDRHHTMQHTPPGITPWAPDKLDRSLMRARSKALNELLQSRRKAKGENFSIGTERFAADNTPLPDLGQVHTLAAQ